MHAHTSQRRDNLLAYLKTQDIKPGEYITIHPTHFYEQVIGQRVFDSDWTRKEGRELVQSVRSFLEDDGYYIERISYVAVPSDEVGGEEQKVLGLHKNTRKVTKEKWDTYPEVFLLEHVCRPGKPCKAIVIGRYPGNWPAAKQLGRLKRANDVSENAKDELDRVRVKSLEHKEQPPKLLQS